MNNAHTVKAASAVQIRTRTRWLILAMLFAITTINYADRATISLAGPDIKKELGLSGVQMGFVFSAFAWSYVVAQLPGGWLLDRFGSKITYLFSIFLWSTFTLFTGAAGITTPIAIGYIVDATGSFAGALVYVGANAALAIACYLFVVGDITRVKLVTSLSAR
ncbi:MFS transporter [Massilia sp. TW-1]|uniref:MFS transporter n=1 Tax=Telluria antibiotica TaxID=2717319 RepID=A0ABX0P4R0_9BURK|nr:MFS transporter [Telluria antibiotica]